MPNTLGLVLGVLALLVVIGAPVWPHMAHFEAGWGPSGLFGAVLVALLVLWLLGVG